MQSDRTKRVRVAPKRELLKGCVHCDRDLAEVRKAGHNDERRPPDNPSTPGQPYDSIFAEQGVGNHGTQQHNEYVVFHGQQCYPEYIVWYTTS